jgi:hypothetical protein
MPLVGDLHRVEEPGEPRAQMGACFCKLGRRNTRAEGGEELACAVGSPLRQRRCHLHRRRVPPAPGSPET